MITLKGRTEWFKPFPAGKHRVQIIQIDYCGSYRKFTYQSSKHKGVFWATSDEQVIKFFNMQPYCEILFRESALDIDFLFDKHFILTVPKTTI